MTKPGNVNTPPSIRRHRQGLTRSAAACERCRRRKQKCDGRTPTCGPCQTVGVICVPSRRLILDQANTDCQCDLLRNQLLSLQEQYDDIQLRFDQLQTEKRSGLENLAESMEFDTAVPDAPPADTLPAVQCNGTPTLVRGPLRPRDSSDTNTDSSYSGRILRPTFTPHPNFRDAYRSALSSAWNLWGDDAAMSDASAANMASHNISVMVDINDATFYSLVDVFFERRSPYLPVLHRPSFVFDHFNHFLARSATSPITKFLVYMVCAIAAAEQSPTRQMNIDHRIFFRQAIQDLHVVIRADDFECIQCLLLLCMYGHNEPQSVNMWYTTSLALQLALGIDLHRKESLRGQTVVQAEMAKRVFWCVYVMSCSMSINMGRPLGIREDDITTPLPLPLSDDQLNETFSPPDPPLLPQVTDTSTFIHIIQMRKINAKVYRSFHSIGRTSSDHTELETTRKAFYSELNHWLITAPRYLRTMSTFQSQEWFQIAYHHAVLSLFRPSRAVPMPSAEDLQLCTESAIGLITSYSSLYARNRIKYTFVAIHSLFMAAVTMLYALRASPALRHELSKPVIQTNILTFLTLFRGISNGRAVGEKCSTIIERLGNSILTLFDEGEPLAVELDTEFQSWFGLQTHTFPTPSPGNAVGEMDHGLTPPDFPDVRIDLPWMDLFTEGVELGSADAWGFLS
ncbi:transcription factor domain-containing protein [Aspergillus undulatus]|uniref:transcription factor domain-containing protein n=1 Tax=Aspergillus undulatus TaxID=1810928 RepID=UPI003CCCFFC3